MMGLSAERASMTSIGQANGHACPSRGSHDLPRLRGSCPLPRQRQTLRRPWSTSSLRQSLGTARFRFWRSWRSDCFTGAVPGPELSVLMKACYERSWHGMNVTDVPMGRHTISSDHSIRKTIMLMKKRVAATINLDEIASEAGLSRLRSYRLFRENLGITPNVYLNTLCI